VDLVEATMNKRARSGPPVWLSLFSGLILLLPVANTANAGTTSETETFVIGIGLNPMTSGAAPKHNSASDFASYTLTFDQFDPSQGTLTGIRFILESEVERKVSVDVTDAIGNGVAGAADLDLFIRLAFPAGQLGAPIFPDVYLLAADCASIFDTCSGSNLPGNAPKDEAFDVNAADFAGFIGLGTFSPAIFEDLAVGVDLTAGFALATGHGTGAWRGDVTVEYTFTENHAVPEPGTLT
jgi:hypothetical protein